MNKKKSKPLVYIFYYIRYASERFMSFIRYAKADVSAKKKEKGKNTRVSRAYGDKNRTHRSQAAASKRA